MCDELIIQASSIPPNLMLVVDKSGSMRDDTCAIGCDRKIDDAKTALTFLLNEGEGQIRVGWMPFPVDSLCEPGVLDADCADDSVPTILTKIAALSANGGTPHQAGIDTFVIGLGEDLNNSGDPSLLNDMAVAGGRARAWADKYYKTNSLNELQTTLQNIGGIVIGCNLALGVVPEEPNSLWVYFDGVPVPRDRNHINGWDYDPVRNHVNFYGPACDQLRSGQVGDVDIKMGCAPPD